MRLSGIVAILSGGTRGTGEAMVRGIIAEGGRLAFGGRNEAAGQRIAAGCAKTPSTVAPMSHGQRTGRR